MKIGIIGYGSMGRMLLRKFYETGAVPRENLLASNRTPEKVKEAADFSKICVNNRELAKQADIVFLCVRPSDMKDVILEIRDVLKPDVLLVSLNGSISFELLSKITPQKMAKVIPGVMAEINRSQTLVCFNESAEEHDKEALTGLLRYIGNVIELPENEIGMGAELVSCMPGFIASIFDVICRSAGKHTAIPEEQVKNMVLNTMSATAELMLKQNLSFGEVTGRVATKGGITEEGTKVIYRDFPETVDLLFEKTLEKRRIVSENAKKSFEENL